MDSDTPRHSAVPSLGEPSPAATAVCEPPPITLFDVEELSKPLPNGTYFAGMVLRPMTPEERADLVVLSFTSVGGTREIAERYRVLRARRAAESIVIRWEIRHGAAEKPVELRNQLQGYGGLTTERAFIWGPDSVGAHDRHLLGHALLTDAFGINGDGRSSNDYIDLLLPPIQRFGTRWVLSAAEIMRWVLRNDLEWAAREAREAGVNVAEVLAEVLAELEAQ